MKRAVVTGATGFVGANLVRRLLADGIDVHCLTRPGHQQWRLDEIRNEIAFTEVDIEDEVGLERTLRGIRPDWVFHLAVYGAYPTQTDASLMRHTNILGTAALVSAALKIGFEAFVNTGSSSEYGPKDHAPSEAELLEPNSDYAVTKASATLLCRHVGVSTGTNMATLRLYSAYGAWEEPTRLIPTLAARGLQRRLPRLASPSIARDFVHVDDVVEAFVLAARNLHEPGAVYNVGTGIQLSLAQVVNIAREELGIPSEPEWGALADRSWDTSVWVSDSKKAREILGWTPRVPFRDGFKQFVTWLRADIEKVQFYQGNAAP